MRDFAMQSRGIKSCPQDLPAIARRSPPSGKLGNFQQLAIFQSGLMGNDARDGHVQRLRDVYNRSAILENSRNEIVHEVTVRTTVSAGGDAGWERRAFGNGQLLFQAFVFAIERAPLSAHAPHL